MWFTTRPVGTHTGLLAGTIKPTGKKVEAPPQSCSMKFDAFGKATEFTTGYVMDRRLGNTGGLGGVFAFFYAVGAPLPFPEGRAWKMSFQAREPARPDSNRRPPCLCASAPSALSMIST